MQFVSETVNHLTLNHFLTVDPTKFGLDDIKFDE